MRLIVLLLLLGVSLLTDAQTLHVKRIELSGGNIIVHYSLLDTVPGRTYNIDLYASRDNYINPLTHLTGDHGLQVETGNSRTVTWNAKEELGASFEGSVSIELRARAYVAFIQFDNFDKIKRGKHQEVTWRGGTKQNVLNFELYNKKNERVAVIPNIPNAGHTSLLIPGNVKPGKGYTFKIVDSKNKDQAIKTEPFTIKRKIPIAVVIAGVAAVGGGIALLGGGGGSEKDGSGDEDIIDPVGTPGN